MGFGTRWFLDFGDPVEGGGAQGGRIAPRRAPGSGGALGCGCIGAKLRGERSPPATFAGDRIAHVLKLNMVARLSRRVHAGSLLIVRPSSPSASAAAGVALVAAAASAGAACPD